MTLTRRTVVVLADFRPMEAVGAIQPMSEIANNRQFRLIDSSCASQWTRADLVMQFPLTLPLRSLYRRMR
jgi:hypothetical protein